MAEKEGKKKSIFKRWWFWLIVIIVIIAIAGGGNSGTSSNSSSNDSSSSSATTEQSAATDSSADSGSSSSSAAADDSTKINADKFAQIEQGMTYEQVVNIIGSEGTEQTTNQIGDTTTTVYEWDSDGWGNASVTFQNGKVVNKTQVGVSDASEAKATMDKYNQVDTGMTYDQVVQIMGGEGQLQSDTSVAGTTSQLYSWDGESLGSSCSITFSDGKVQSKAQYGLDN